MGGMEEIKGAVSREMKPLTLQNFTSGREAWKEGKEGVGKRINVWRTSSEKGPHFTHSSVH